MRNKDEKVPNKILRSFQKILRRKGQDIERGIEKPGQFYLLFSHKIEKDDLTGDPKKLGQIVPPEFDPNTPSSEIDLSTYFIKRFQRWLLGKRPPQKRVRPKHKRDNKLAGTPPIVKKSSVTEEATIHRYMDNLVFKKIESVNDIEFAKADKKARKRYTQSKYRYIQTTAKKTS